MHLVPFYRFALDRFECPGPDQQRQFFTAETFGIQVGQYFWCEMKSRLSVRQPNLLSWSKQSDKSLNHFFRFPVKVRRYRKFSRSIQYFGKAETAIPTETYLVRLSVTLHFFGR